MTISDQSNTKIEPAYAGRQALAIFRPIALVMKLKMSFANDHKPLLSI